MAGSVERAVFLSPLNSCNAPETPAPHMIRGLAPAYRVLVRNLLLHEHASAKASDHGPWSGEKW